jgi:D-inositol-3-phosphate glycosyltransferase
MSSLVERVALLCLHSSPLAPLGSTDAGGMNLYVHLLAKKLGAGGVLVDVFTRRTGKRAPEIVQLGEGARLIHVLGGQPARLPKRLLPFHLHEMVDGIRCFADREKIRYDVFHSHYWLSGLAAIQLRTDPCVPIVHMFHTLSRVKEIHVGEVDPRDTSIRVDGERACLGVADAVVGATAGELDYLEKLYHSSPRSFSVIPPGVDISVFRPIGKEESRRTLSIGEGTIILFVGRPDRIKGFHVLLQAVSDIRQTLGTDVKLLVVGAADTGDAGERQSHIKQVRELGLDDVVEFRGAVSQGGLPAYYSAADICAIPSAYESFGMVAVEAMACQTPVVAFAVGGLNSTIKDNQTGFLAAAGNQAAFTATLQRALASPDLDTIGRRARISVQRYDWNGVAARTLELYENLVLDKRFEYPQACGLC